MVSKLRAVARFLGSVWVTLFGRWQPPAWLGFLGKKAAHAGRWSRTHRSASALIALLAVAVFAGGYFGYRAWKNRPQPELAKLTLTAPALTPLQEPLVPAPLIIDFDRSVAPLERVEKKLKRGVSLKPPVNGTWKWVSDRQLSFVPNTDWPVGQELEVRFEKEGFTLPNVTLESYELEFKTAPFEVQLEQSEFYQDPTTASLKKAVATFAFSHPVDATSFEKNLKLAFVPSNKEERTFEPKFHVTYDKLKARAFVHSEALPIPQKDAEVVFTLKPGAKALAGGPPKQAELVGKVAVPGLYNFFRLGRVHAEVVDNPRMEPEQVLFVETSTGVGSSELTGKLSAWTLPIYHPTEQSTPESRERPYRWSEPEAVSPAILKASTKLPLEGIASAREYDTVHSFRHGAPIGRFLYVVAKKGIKAFGGYVLGEQQQFIVEVPPFPRQLKIMHSGALLSSRGEQKITVFARDVPQLKFQVARILPAQIQHLVAGTWGEFAKPHFIGGLDLESIASFEKEEVRTLPETPGKPCYETLDLAPYLPKDGPRRGLFYVKVRSYRGTTALGESDERFILLSDLGVFVKQAVGGARSVFVQSISTGSPVADASVDVLGKNGLPVEKLRTDAQGRADFGSLDELSAEKEPVLILVNAGTDTSFVPWDRRDRELDVSRFDIGGIAESEEAGKLSAYGFSDRTLYRPEDTFHVGFIVRRQDWQRQYAGLPLVATVVDPRGIEVKSQPVTLDESGFAALDYTTRYTSPTGGYDVNLYLAKDGLASDLLGSTTVQVREFLPDRMKIKVELSQKTIGSWTKAEGLDAEVTLTNLYGTPASNKRIEGRIRLKPGMPIVPRFADYRFRDPLKESTPVEEVLTPVHTDENGVAKLSLGLSRFAPATYRLTVTAEGFEGEGGRSVVAEASAFVSPLPYMIGYKSDADLEYLHLGSSHDLHLVAVSPAGERMAVSGLSQVLAERTYVSTLVQQSNGTYRYESVAKDVERWRKPLALGKGADATVSLPTSAPGSFFLLVKNGEGLELQRVAFQVAGQANLSRNMDRASEVELALANTNVAQGGNLELQIKAPYPGAGLITIERDQVYTHKWFYTDTTATVQQIAVPPGLQGGGYVSVAMIRSATSPDVLMSPLAYGVIPFAIDRDQRRIDIKVESPALVKPGLPMPLKVRADKAARAVVFAVDEGILRVARHPNPDPLGHFMQKRQLGVSTTQILDLILPEHSLLMQALAPGGDDETDANALGANLNPFRRKQDVPAVYWSGLIDVGPEGTELNFVVPDSFAGTLRVMAVAANAEAVGAFVGETLVRGDFVISPSVPAFVAPGDLFDVPVTVANNVEGSGKAASVSLTLETTPHVEVVGDKKTVLTIGALREVMTTFHLRAKDSLGSAGLTFKAALGAASGQRRVDLSVRPATPFSSTLNVGYVRNGKKKVAVERKLYSAFRTLKTGLSPVPSTLASGLSRYLENFPHGCTEQVTSQAIPALVMASPGGGEPPSAEAAATMARYIETVVSRQNDEGGFGAWGANPTAAPLASVYTMLVLSEAKERGFAVPAQLLERGLNYLSSLADQTPDNLAGARLRAMAIYTLTRNAKVTTRFAAAAQKHMEANYEKTWRGDLACAYLAGTYALLQDQALADKLGQDIVLGRERTADYSAYYDAMAHDAQALYILAKHFPARAARLKAESLDGMLRTIEAGRYNTFSSAFSILALDAFGRAAAANKETTRSIVQLVAGKSEPLPTSGKMVDFSPKANALEFSVQGDFGAYYVVSQEGFEQQPPSTVRRDKLEVFREYIDNKDAPVSEVAAGQEMRVRLRVRSLDGYVNDGAIVDLLPGGFEVVVQSAAATPGQGRSESDESGEGVTEGEEEVEEDESGGAAPGFALPIALPGSDLALSYGDIREDRVVLYANFGPEVRTFIYAIKATNAGKYVVPPIQAESLYDRTARASGVAGKVSVRTPSP